MLNKNNQAQNPRPLGDEINEVFTREAGNYADLKISLVASDPLTYTFPIVPPEKIEMRFPNEPMNPFQFFHWFLHSNFEGALGEMRKTNIRDVGDEGLTDARNCIEVTHQSGERAYFLPEIEHQKHGPRGVQLRNAKIVKGVNTWKAANPDASQTEQKAAEALLGKPSGNMVLILAGIKASEHNFDLFLNLDHFRPLLGALKQAAPGYISWDEREISSNSSDHAKRRTINFIYNPTAVKDLAQQYAELFREARHQPELPASEIIHRANYKAFDEPANLSKVKHTTWRLLRGDDFQSAQTYNDFDVDSISNRSRHSFWSQGYSVESPQDNPHFAKLRAKEKSLIAFIEEQLESGRSPFETLTDIRLWYEMQKTREQLPS